MQVPPSERRHEASPGVLWLCVDETISHIVVGTGGDGDGGGGEGEGGGEGDGGGGEGGGGGGGGLGSGEGGGGFGEGGGLGGGGGYESVQKSSQDVSHDVVHVRPQSQVLMPGRQYHVSHPQQPV